MRAEKQPDELHTALARMTWNRAPSVRLHHHRDDDYLVIEFEQADEVAEIDLAPHLMVDVDGTDPGKRPTALYLTGLAADPESTSARAAREIAGEQVWSAVEALVAAGGEKADVPLSLEEAAARVLAWKAMPEWWDPAVIGVEFTPGRVYAVLTSDRGFVLDEEIVDLTCNDENSVVRAIADVCRLLSLRHPGTAAGTCPVAVQLGGPVDTGTGYVEYYDKPLNDGDDFWMGVPLGDLVTEATGRETCWVFNDARAFAEYEIEVGIGNDQPKVVVMMVRHGIGAKLVQRGVVVEDYPMELGVFIDDVVSESAPGGRSIEAKSGITATIDGIERVCGWRPATIAEAADMASVSDQALILFREAGRALATAVAAVQSVINPDRWVVYGPAALVDECGPASAAFMQELRKAHDRVAYGGLWVSLIIPRSTTGPLGARAAAVAGIRSGRLAQPPGRSPQDVRGR